MQFQAIAEADYIQRRLFSHTAMQAAIKWTELQLDQHLAAWRIEILPSPRGACLRISICCWHQSGNESQSEPVKSAAPVHRDIHGRGPILSQDINL